MKLRPTDIGPVSSERQSPMEQATWFFLAHALLAIGSPITMVKIFGLLFQLLYALAR